MLSAAAAPRAFAESDRVLVTAGPWVRVGGVVVRLTRGGYVVKLDGALWDGFWFAEHEVDSPW